MREYFGFDLSPSETKTEPRPNQAHAKPRPNQAHAKPRTSSAIHAASPSEEGNQSKSWFGGFFGSGSANRNAVPKNDVSNSTPGQFLKVIKTRVDKCHNIAKQRDDLLSTKPLPGSPNRRHPRTDSRLRSESIARLNKSSRECMTNLEGFMDGLGTGINILKQESSAQGQETQTRAGASYDFRENKATVFGERSTKK